MRAGFEARANHSHLPAENELPVEVYRGRSRQLSWWRTWHDRERPSLPALVAESSRRTRRRAVDDHLRWVRERLADRYAAEADLRTRLGIPVPPTGRPKRPTPRAAASVKGRLLRDFDEPLAEWDWAFNGDLDPLTLPAGSRERVAWRCLLDPAHVWETRIADRTYHPSFCPYHMGVRVHPAESLAAFFPWLAREWHPRNALGPHEVSRASGRRVVWLCERGHEWSAAVYQRTLSKSGCPECYRQEASLRSRAGKIRARDARDRRLERQLDQLVALNDLAAGNEPF